MSPNEGDQYQQRRELMVQRQLKQRDISDEAVLDAFRSVPREVFVREADRDRAYDDRALPTSSGQTISQPYMVAKMTQLLEVKPGNRVLEIGTGSGYQTAILVEMGARVYTMDIHEELTRGARQKLEELGYSDQVSFKVGDGSLGWPEEAPFDRVLVTAGAPEVPEPLINQTAVGGRLVIPIGSRTGQHIHVLTKTGEDRWQTNKSVACVFVPLVGEEGWDETTS